MDLRIMTACTSMLLILVFTGVSMTAAETLKVVTHLSKPWCYLRNDNSTDDVYEGYIPDLLELLAERTGYEFELYPVEDGLFGHRDANGTWSGMIGDLVSNKADFAAAPLSITAARHRVVDFAHPFLKTQLAVLGKAPDRSSGIPSSTSLIFSIFSFEVWFMIAMAFLLTSLLFGFYGRLLPMDYRKQKEDNQSPGFLDAGWLVYKSLLLQGWRVDSWPPSLAYKALAGSWLCFLMLVYLLCLSYFIMLAPSMNAPRQMDPYAVSSLEELSSQTQIQYGTIKDTATSEKFSTSRRPVYERMHNYMSSMYMYVNQSVGSVEEGLEKVSRGNYFFILDGMDADYALAVNCGVMEVLDRFDAMAYGLAFPIGSPHHDTVSEGILNMQEHSDLLRIYDKWILERGECPAPQKRPDPDTVYCTPRLTTLGSDILYGPLVLLAAGMVTSVIIAAVEIFYSCHRRRRQRNE